VSGLRDRELHDVLEVMTSVDVQPDRAVLVTGEAGIGKTHLARDVVDRLERDGFASAWGRADPVERAVPYAAIAQVLSTGDGHEGLHDLDGRGFRGPDAVLHEVYRPVAALLAARCADAPLVVTIDDLHYADEDTLVLIGFLVRRLVEVPIMWLFTSRSHLAEPAPALTQLLHRLREDRRLEEVVLARMSTDDVTTLVVGVVGRPVDAHVLDVIVERASGNPFFAIQLALSLAEAGVLDRVDPVDSSSVVPSVSRRVALLERVFPLGEGARTLARLAAVCGDIDVDQLERLAGALGLDVATAHDGFDRLVRADLLRPVGERRYGFAHDLVRETLYDDLGPAERRRLHRVAAQALLDRRTDGQPIDLVELGHHLSLSGVEPDARAVDALREAGDALVRAAPRSAALRYRQAIGFLPDDSGASALHVRLAQALHRAGDPREVVRVCRHGLTSARGGDRDRLTRYLAAALADTGAFSEALELVAAELTSAGDSVVLLTTQALLLRQLEDFTAAARAIDRAEAAARTTAERLTVLFQRLNLGVDIGAPAHGGVALDELERLLPSLDPETRLMAHAHAAGACAGAGETHRGVDHLDAMDTLIADQVTDIDWPWSFSARVALNVQRGRWDNALAVYEHGSPEFTAGLRLLARNHAITPISDVSLMRRDADRTRRFADEVAELSLQSTRMKALALSKVDRVEGRPADGAARLEAALRGAPPGAPFTMYVLSGLIDCHARSGAAGMDEVVAELAAAAKVVDTVTARLLLALIGARLRDEVDAAREGLDLVTEHGHHRYDPEFHFHLGRLGVDPERNLTKAHRGWDALGAVEELDRVEAAMRRHGVRVPSRRGADRFALSHAERRVAELVGEGLTNRAIADRLAYSVKTIEAYLSRIYAKTGCANRVELSRYLAAERQPAGEGPSQPPATARGGNHEQRDRR
jgi:DNA-binding CsgD family transcriptional regulator